LKLEVIKKELVEKYIKKMGIKLWGIILLMGIFLMMIGKSNKIDNYNEKNFKNEVNENRLINNSSNENKIASENYCKEIENSLKRMIKKIRGVEEAEVIVTLKSSKEEVVLKDIPYEKEKMGEEELYCENEETVMLEDKEGNTHPYIVKELNPKVEGIVVGIRTVNEQVKKDIIEVVQVLFDIPIHKIKIVNIN
jgi:stage III sporulation protein AG